VLWLVLTLALIFVGLIVFFWVGSLFIQGYFYEGPTADLYWRAPAAAGAVTLFLAFFCLLAKKYDVDTVFRFTSGSEKPFDSFYSVLNGKETRFVRDKDKKSFVDENQRNKNWGWNSSDGVVDTIIVIEDGNRVAFKADLTPQGKPRDPAKGIRYLEEGGGGRLITGDDLGSITKPQPGRTFLMILVNIIHFVVWFLAIWLLLEYQWPHAFLLALPFWAATTLVVLPPMVDKLTS
jgi:hypothetical protein